MKVIVAAAGTAGHINPGLAIANKIKKEEPNSEIIFIGTDRGLENDLVPKAGYKLRKIEVYGLKKEISLQNFKKIYKTFKSIGEAKKIVKEFQPDIVIRNWWIYMWTSKYSSKKIQYTSIITWE